MTIVGSQVVKMRAFRLFGEKLYLTLEQTAAAVQWGGTNYV